jgi:hypothetical protein
MATSVSTDPLTQSGLIYITPHADDGPEITHFRISAITNGNLFQADGVTPIADNEFITLAQGLAGLRFTPTSAANGSFWAESSEDGLSVAAQSAAAISTIRINSSPPEQPPEPPEVIGPPGQLEPPPSSGEPPPPDPPAPDIGPSDEGVVEDDGPVTSSLPAGDDLPDLADIAPTTVTRPENTEPEAASEDMSGDDSAADQSSVGAETQSRESDSQTSENRLIQIPVVADLGTLILDLAYRQVSLAIVATETFETIGKAAQAGYAEQPLYQLSRSLLTIVDIIYKERPPFEYQLLRNSLDSLQDEVNQEGLVGRTLVGSAIAATTGLSVGYVIWLLRTGALLSSVLASMPAWQLADPMAVLARQRRKDQKARDESLGSIIENGEKTVRDKQKKQTKDPDVSQPKGHHR